MCPELQDHEQQKDVDNAIFPFQSVLDSLGGIDDTTNITVISAIILLVLLFVLPLEKILDLVEE